MDVLHHAPALTRADAAALARRLYGLDADASPLPSERDQNFLLTMPFTRENAGHLASTLDEVPGR